MLRPEILEILTLDANQSSVSEELVQDMPFTCETQRLTLDSTILKRPTERTHTAREGTMFPNCELNVPGEQGSSRWTLLPAFGYVAATAVSCTVS
jgi:hypothetical protein